MYHIYVIDLDERGIFRSHIEDEHGSCLYSFDEDHLSDLMTDGFIRHYYDGKALIEYYFSLGLLE